MKDGYPDRVCDYCHLQLNTFHAFVKKAKTTSNQFAKIIEDVVRADLIEQNELEPDSDIKCDSISMSEMEFDVQPEETNAQHFPEDLDLIINKENDDSTETPEIENDCK